MCIFHTWDKVVEVINVFENNSRKIYLYKKCRKCKKEKFMDLLILSRERIYFGDKTDV